MKSKINIGLFGFGCVAQGFYAGLKDNPQLDVQIKKICVRNEEKPRTIASDLFTNDATELLDDEDVDIIIELIDDAYAAVDIIKKALISGKSVISANKKAIAEHLPEFVELQRAHHSTLLYEGAVGGAIPILNSLDLFYRNHQVTRIRAILNGTCNFILSSMKKSGISFQEALKIAQNKGFAESDPYLDVSGFDSVYKAVILGYHTFGYWVDPQLVEREGIEYFNPEFVLQGRKENQKLKLIASIEQAPGNVGISVKPIIIKEDDPLYYVDSEKNAVVVEDAFSGEHVFQGNGAGSYPTGSAVLNDLKLALEGFRYSFIDKNYLKTA